MNIFSVVNLARSGNDTDTTEDCTTDDSSDDSSVATFQEPPELVDRDDSSISSFDLDSDSEDEREWMKTVRVPPFSKVFPDPDEVNVSVPEVVKALNQITDDLRVLDISAVEYYKKLQISEVLLSAALPPRGHCDGGALATTTDRLEYIWCYHVCSITEQK